MAAAGNIDDEVLIQPSAGWAAVGLGELWAHRELLYFLAWRDIKIRYKQTVLGIGWAVLQPVLTMLIFALFFGRLARMPSDGVPYPLFALAALVPWIFFANGMTLAANSLVNAAHLIRKVYFPRLTIPASAVLSGLPDFLFSFAALLVLMSFYRVLPRPSAVLWVPVLLLLAFVAALGAGLWLSALNVRYRDVHYVVGFLAQLWMFATPIVYPASLLSESGRLVYSLNPMVGVVEGFRYALLRTPSRPGLPLLVSAAAAVLMFVTGIYYFRRTERTFADTI